MKKEQEDLSIRTQVVLASTMALSGKLLFSILEAHSGTISAQDPISESGISNEVKYIVDRYNNLFVQKSVDLNTMLNPIKPKEKKQ